MSARAGDHPRSTPRSLSNAYSRTLAGFDYPPGLILDPAAWLTVFKEDEFQDTVSRLA